MENYLSEYIALKRIEKNLSYRDLEKLSGVSHVTIQDIESGKTKDPGVTKVVKLARALGIKPGPLILAIEGFDPRLFREDYPEEGEVDVLDALEDLVDRLKKQKKPPQ